MFTLGGFVHGSAPWAAAAVVVIAFLQAVAKRRSANSRPVPPSLRWADGLPGLAALGVAGLLGVLPALLAKPPSAAEEAELRDVYFEMQPACVDYLLAFADRHEWRGGGSANVWDSVQALPPPEFTEENYRRMRPIVDADYVKFVAAMRDAVDAHSLLPRELRALVDEAERVLAANRASYDALHAAPDAGRFAEQVRAPLAAVRAVCDRVTALQAALPLP
jgi:hypothetical protein